MNVKFACEYEFEFEIYLKFKRNLSTCFEKR